jgi:glycine betaine/proline transport system substrate-binding protein
MDKAMNEQDLSDAMVRPLVKEWIAANRETVDGWLEAARAAAH